jgi:hypothetical protein
MKCAQVVAMTFERRDLQKFGDLCTSKKFDALNCLLLKPSLIPLVRIVNAENKILNDN